MEAGMSGYLAKPLRLESLTAALLSGRDTAASGPFN
jgi:hypothetical protein